MQSHHEINIAAAVQVLVLSTQYISWYCSIPFVSLSLAIPLIDVHILSRIAREMEYAIYVCIHIYN